MKILLGNNTLDLLAGSETWTRSLAKAFVDLGHDVSAYSPHLGRIAVDMEAMGIRCTDKAKRESGIKPFSLRMEPEPEVPDVIICNHYEVTKTLHAAYPGVPIIATVHGILHKDQQTGQIWPEHPVTEFTVDQYVAVSEEVQKLLESDYGIKSEIIRNAFDLDVFEYVGRTNEKPKVFLINSNYSTTGDPVMEVLRELKEHYGAEIRAIGHGFGAQVTNPEQVIRDVDIVFGMGRSLLEGMAMGKLAICHGRWGTGGVLTPETYDSIKQFNFSGRNSAGQLMAKEDLIAAIDAAFTEENVVAMRKKIEEEHDVKKAALSYIGIAERLLKKT